MNRTILLVEDNPADQKLALRALERSGVASRVDVVGDGVEALEYLLGDCARHTPAAELPALVLLDVQLPRLDGTELLVLLRSDPRTKLLPVVMLTASLEAQDVQRCYERGANAYVRKPVDFLQFVELTRTVSRFWLEINERPPGIPGGAP